jgi:hypothetical protein
MPKKVDVWLGPFFIHLFNCAESALAGHNKIEHCWEPESSILVLACGQYFWEEEAIGEWGPGFFWRSFFFQKNWEIFGD